MISLNRVKGQRNAVRYLEKSVLSGKIVNGYLFSGPIGVGRATCAKAFIAELFCPEKHASKDAFSNCPTCRRIGSETHPDLVWIKEEKNKAIGIDRVRKARDVLNLKPYEARYNICVVEDAHMMTQEAANAILKVLEEPPEHSLIIAITNKKELLPATFISRCVEVRFGYLSLPETRDIISGLAGDEPEESAWFAAYFSQGSPGAALDMIKEKSAARKDDLAAMVDSVISAEEAVFLTWDKDDKNQLIEDIDILVMFLRDIVVGKEVSREKMFIQSLGATGMYRFFSAYSPRRIYNLIESLINMKTGLLGNMNSKLAAQSLPEILVSP